MMFSPSSVCGWLDQQVLNAFLFSSSRFSSKLEDDERRKKRLVFLFGVLVVLGVATTEMMRFGDVLARIAFASLFCDEHVSPQRKNKSLRVY